MKNRSILIVGWICLMMIVGGATAVLAAEEASTMMCDEGVVNFGIRMLTFRKNVANPTASRWTSGSMISAHLNISP